MGSTNLEARDQVPGTESEEIKMRRPALELEIEDTGLFVTITASNPESLPRLESEAEEHGLYPVEVLSDWLLGRISRL